MKDKWPLQRALLYIGFVVMVMLVKNETTLLRILAIEVMAILIVM